jgi:hypothetical protein
MGTGEAGATVTVSDGSTILGTVTVAANGTWTLPLTSQLTAGTHSLTATETDPAGNVSPVFATYPVVIETSAPAPIITGLTPATDTGASQTDGITSDTTPVLTGSGEAGATVTVSEGSTVLGTAVVAANGTWTLALTTPLSSGTHALTATETDPAGNVSPASAPLDVTIETSAPAPSITGVTPAPVNGVTPDPTPTIMGTGEPGAVVTLTDNGVVIGMVTVGANGTWSFPVATPLADGPHDLSATETDPAGNLSAPSAPYPLSVEPGAPPAPAITGITQATDTGVLGDGLTSDRQPTVIGTAAPGSLVTIYDGSTVLGTTTANAAGQWSFTPNLGLADGTHQLSATATDSAGITGPRSAVDDLQIVPTTLSTIGPVTWLGGGAQTFALPSGVFSIPSGDTPVYAAHLVAENGAALGPLPSWMKLDPATGLLTGAVPTGVNGTFQIEITITDNHGDVAIAVFTLTYEGPSPTQAALMAGPAPILSPEAPAVPPTPQPASSPFAAAGPATAAQAAAATNLSAALAPQEIQAIEASVTTTEPVTNLVVAPGATVNSIVGADSFNVTDSMSVLTLSASLADGRPLPAWLSFDPQTGILSGRVPSDFAGALCNTATPHSGRAARHAGATALDVLITARDAAGHTAFTHVRIATPGTQSDECGPGEARGHASLDRDPAATARYAEGNDRVAPATLHRLHGQAARQYVRPGLTAQIKASHPGQHLVAQAALLRAAEQMLHRL